MNKPSYRKVGTNFKNSILNTFVKFYCHLQDFHLKSERVAGDAVLYQPMLGVIQICQLGADADDEYHTVQQLDDSMIMRV